MIYLKVESKSHSSIILIPKLHKSTELSVIGNYKAKEPALQRDCSSFLPHQRSRAGLTRITKYASMTRRTLKRHRTTIMQLMKH